MTSIAALTKTQQKPRSRKRGFTLAEVLIAVSISSVFMSGITSSYIFIFKSSLGMSQYIEMSTQSQIGLERFGRDMRMAVDVSAATSTAITLEVQGESGTSTVQYIYDSSSKSLNRIDGSWNLTVISNIESLSFRYYNLLGNTTTNPVEVKKIQLEALLEKTVFEVKNTTNIVSAKFMLRNRKVST